MSAEARIVASPESAASTRRAARFGITGYAREPNDFYIEPAWIVERLLDVEDFPGGAWDPAAGSGTVPTALRARGIPCAASDRVDRGFPGTEVLDFLADDPAPRAPSIVSNPPYAVMEAWARRALALTTGKVALLGRLAFLEGVCRDDLFASTPLARVWISRRRVNMPPGGRSDIERRGGMVAFAWFVWEIGYVGKPTIGRI